MKPIIILGKGPSARKIISSDKYDVATLNNAVWFCKDPTFAFFNDLEPIEQMTDEDFRYVKTLAVPTYIHSMKNPRFNNQITDLHFSKLYDIFPKRFDHLDIYLYSFNSKNSERLEELERMKKDPTPVSLLPEWPGSVGGSASLVLSKFIGYKKFIFCGIDPAGGYHEKFTKSVDENGKPLFGGMSTTPGNTADYSKYYHKMIEWIERYGGTAKHINDLTSEEKEYFEL
jgi:hypothetical protein